MKNLDWSLILFVGVSLTTEYWNYWGLPRVYYWNLKKEVLEDLETKSS
ncbi:hypothetical protein [Ornithinibacillus halophilus]|uniref:Uncharacterized protein n=1 Tax=Ornithinibacillus halophilus TaxID=930117 RepID=A0A1M5CJ18_9BACI|nr:hypothetical protein [Ornithinibacillus halophilus]SHF54718.1 hypothetical protein SAMN05216225_1001269 [Ornithinibacillus halophilus]